MANHDGMDLPQFSCIVIFLNAADHLDDAIRSILSQRNAPAFEIVLVDDGSTDGSTEMARSWALNQPDVIRYVDHPGHENRGMSASRNLGLSISVGEFIAFLDSDDIWLPGMLANRAHLFRSFPTADVVVGAFWTWTAWAETSTASGDQVNVLASSEPRHSVINPPSLFLATYSNPNDWRVPGIIALAIRRSALVELEGFDESFKGMYEDQVFYTKCFLGARVVIDDRPLALWRRHPASAVAQSLSSGELHHKGPNPARTKFITWMKTYVAQHPATTPDVREVIERNTRAELLRNAEPSTKAKLRRQLSLTARRWTPPVLLEAVRGRRPKPLVQATERPTTDSPTQPAERLAFLQRLWALQVFDEHLVGSTRRISVLDDPAHPIREMRSALIENLEARGVSNLGRADEIDWIVGLTSGDLSERAQPLLDLAESANPKCGIIMFSTFTQVPGGSSGDATSSPTRSGSATLEADARVERFGSPRAMAWVSGQSKLNDLGAGIDLHDDRCVMFSALVIARPPADALGVM